MPISFRGILSLLSLGLCEMTAFNSRKLDNKTQNAPSSPIFISRTFLCLYRPLLILFLIIFQGASKTMFSFCFANPVGMVSKH